MKQVVYVDVLFVLNLFINYFLLLSVAKIMRFSAKRWRILCGALLGGAYSLMIFLPTVATWFSVLLKMIFSVTLVLTSFKFNSFKHFLKLLGCFYAVNFAFAGIMLALWFAFKPNGMVINNGVVYFNISMLVLAVSAVAAYLIISIISKLMRRNAPDSHIYEISISVDGKKAETRALMDTGNALSDSFSDTPVIVAEYKFVEPVLPGELRDFFGGEKEAPDISELRNWKSRIRLIPYHSVDKGGVLPAFRPDNLHIKSVKGDDDIKNVYVAVCKGRLPYSEYGALLNPRVINGKN